jgi:hypothetical protein
MEHLTDWGTMNKLQIAGLLLAGVPIYHGDLDECFAAAKLQNETNELSDQEFLGNLLLRLGIVDDLTAYRHVQ